VSAALTVVSANGYNVGSDLSEQFGNNAGLDLSEQFL
jgi:hypothetical protein